MANQTVDEIIAEAEKRAAAARGETTTPNVSNPGAPAPARNTPSALEQHLSTGATGHPTSSVSGGRTTNYGGWQGNVPPSSPAPGSGFVPRAAYVAPPPAPRAPFGTFTTNDLNARTIPTGQGTRLDPYSGQKYTQGPDMSWRTAGFEPRENVQGIIAQSGLPPISSNQINPTSANIAMSANPGLRQGAGLAGTLGTLQPQDTPHYASLSDYRMPGLGFNAADYKPMQIQPGALDKVSLGAPVTRTNYGFDYGGGPNHASNTRTTGEAAVQTESPKFQVPNGYMPGPSGFSINSPNGPAFQAFAMPFGVSLPTLPGVTPTAPASLTPTGTRDQYNRNEYAPLSNDIAPVTPLSAAPPGAVGRPGGAGAMWQNGSQTFDVRGGGTGFGANADTILKDYGRSGVSSDAATRSQAAMALIDKNNELQKQGMSPLVAYMLMNQPSATNFGAPAGNYGPGSGDYGNAGNPGAYGADGPDRGFAAGGSVDTAQLPTAASLGLGGVPAASPLGDGSLTPAPPPRQQTSQPDLQSGTSSAPAAPYVNSTAQLNAPSNSEAAIAPVQSQAAPAATPAPTQGLAPVQPPAMQQAAPVANIGTTDNSVLQPYQDALTRLGVLANQRQADAGRYQAAGLSAPIGIDTLGDNQNASQLPPGMYFDNSGQIKQRVSDITGLQNTLAALGNPGSVEDITQQEIPVQNMQQLFTNIQNAQQQVQALGDTGDPAQLLSAQANLNAQLDKLKQAQGIQTSLGALGQQQDINPLLGQQSAEQQQLAKLQQALGIQTQLSGLGPNADITGLLGQQSSIQSQLDKLSQAQKIQTELSGLGTTGDPAQMAQQEAELNAKLAPLQQYQQLQTELASLPNTSSADLENQLQQLHQQADPYLNSPDFHVENANPAVIGWMQQIQSLPSQIDAAKAAETRRSELQNILSSQGMTAPVTPQIGDLTAQLNALKQQESNAQNSSALTSQYQNQLKALGYDPNADLNAAVAQFQGQLSPIQQQISDAQKQASLRTQYQNQLQSYGVDPNSDLNAAVAQEQAKLTPITQQVQNAQQAAGLRTNYTNQLQSLGYDPNADLSSAVGGVQAQLSPLQQQIANAQQKAALTSQIANMQGQTGGQTQGGVQAQLTQLQQALANSQKVGQTNTELSNLLAQGVPGAGKLPGFAGGGYVQSGVPGYQPPPDSSSKNLAEQMRQMGGLGVTLGQWDPNNNIRNNPAHFAGGGSMTTNEPIVGIGTMTGRKRFIVGEPVTPGGPPRAERLQIKPLHRNAQLPMGKLARSAA